MDQMRKAGVLISSELHETFSEKPIVQSLVIPNGSSKCNENFPISHDICTPAVAENRDNCKDFSSSSDEIVVVKESEPKNEINLESIDKAFEGEEMCETKIQGNLENKKNVEIVSRPKVTLNVNERPRRVIKKPQRLNL